MPDEGGEVSLKGSKFATHGGILRQKSLVKGAQGDLADFYEKHWKMPGAYHWSQSQDGSVQTDVAHRSTPPLQLGAF